MITKETLDGFSTEYLLHLRNQIDEVMAQREDIQIGWYEPEETLAWETPFPPYVY